MVREERLFWGHAQNLNERPGGSMLREGRAWLYVASLCLGIEWHLARWTWPHVGLRFQDAGDDEDLTLTFCPLIFSLYLSLDGLRRFLPFLPEDRECSLAFHDGTLWLKLWCTDDWRSRDTWWRRPWVFHILDTLLGRRHHRSRVLEEREVLLLLPERAYRATATLEEVSWKRTRWPFIERMRRLDLEIPEGVPIPGKHGVEQDAVYASTFPAQSIRLGMNHFMAGILKTRIERQGHAGMLPADNSCLT